MCVETGALLRVGHISIARRYRYRRDAGEPMRDIARITGFLIQDDFQAHGMSWRYR